jgi:hypothetical protein
LTVTAAAITITANNANKTYGTAQSTPVTGSGAYTITSGSLQNGETIGSVTLSYGAGALLATSPVGSTSVITPSAATGGTFTSSNYTITYTTGTLTVTAAALTVTANDLSKCSDQTLTFVGTEFTSSGLVNSDNITSVTLNSLGSPSTASAGSYTITPSAATGSGLSNYSISYVDGTLTVDAVPTTNAGADQSTCDDASLSISGASGANGTISWSVVSGCGTCSFTNGTTLTPTFTPDATGSDHTAIIQISVTGAGGCSSSVVTSNKNITIYATPGTSLINHN